MRPWQIWIVSPSLVIMFFKLIQLWHLRSRYQALTNLDFAMSDPYGFEISVLQTEIIFAWAEIGLMLVILNIVLLLPIMLQKFKKVDKKA
jgi:hypothetical protein